MGDVQEFQVNAPYEDIVPPNICLVCGAPGKERVKFNFKFVYSTLFDEGLLVVWIGALLFISSFVLLYIVGPQFVALAIIGIALMTMGSRHKNVQIEMYICDKGVHLQSDFEGNWIGLMKKTLIQLPENREATFSFSDRDFAHAFEDANRHEALVVD